MIKVLSLVRVAYNACTDGGCAVSPLSAPLLTGELNPLWLQYVSYLYVLIDMEPTEEPESSKISIGLIIGIASGVACAIVVVLLIIIIIYCYRRRSKHQKYQM